MQNEKFLRKMSVLSAHPVGFNQAIRTQTNVQYDSRFIASLERTRKSNINDGNGNPSFLIILSDSCCPKMSGPQEAKIPLNPKPGQIGEQ